MKLYPQLCLHLNVEVLKRSQPNEYGKVIEYCRCNDCGKEWQRWQGGSQWRPQ